MLVYVPIFTPAAKAAPPARATIARALTHKEQTMNSLDLNVASPEELPQVLRRAADVFRESHEQLKLAWQDPAAGLVWAKFAQILDRAATSAEKAIERHFK